MIVDQNRDLMMDDDGQTKMHTQRTNKLLKLVFFNGIRAKMRLFKTVLKPYALYYRRLKMPNIGNKSLRSMAHKSRNARQVGNDCHIVSHFLGLLTTQISLWDRTPPKGSRRRFQSWPAALLKRCWCYSMLLMHTSSSKRKDRLQDYSMISYHGRLVSYKNDAVSRPVCKFSPH